MSLPCNTCKVRFPTRDELMAHYKGELHRANLILQSKKQPILTQEQFDQLKAEEEAKATPPPPSQPEEEEDKGEFNMELCRDIPDTECLFCGKTFENADLALEHMRSHGFRFCYEDKLTDREGLMAYFGEKVGVGHCCLDCSRQFNSLNAVRDHMNGKSHCAYEYDEEVEDFYQPETGLVPVECWEDEIGELHTATGMVFGHRKYQRYYKQRVPTAEQMQKGSRLMLGGPAKPRESITIENDRITRAREYFKQKYISKRERRLVSKDYHPFSDIHRGNA